MCGILAVTVEMNGWGRAELFSEARESRQIFRNKRKLVNTRAFFKLLFLPHLLLSHWIKHIIVEPKSLCERNTQGCGYW